MFFDNGIFNLDFVQDQLTKRVLQQGMQRATTVVRPSDILIAAIESQDPRITAILSQALEQGCTVSDIKPIIEVYNRSVAISPSRPRNREGFSSDTLKALDQFATEILENPHLAQDFSIEVLFACLLAHLESEDREYLTLLNAERGTDFCRRQIQLGSSNQLPLFDPITKQLSEQVFSTQAWNVIKSAITFASHLGSNRLQPAHCFLGLLDEREGITQRLVRLQLRPEMTLASISQRIVDTLRISGHRSSRIDLTWESMDESTVSLFETARVVSQQQGEEQIDSSHLLLALLDHKPSHLISILEQSPLYLDVEKMRRHFNYSPPGTTSSALRPSQYLASLQLPVQDLTYLASTRDYPKAVPVHTSKTHKGSFDIYQTITRALYRRAKNHILIIGQKGVGKTILVKELARRAALGEFPFLKQKQFALMDCQNVTPFESRETFLHLLSLMKDQKECILCLDGLGSLLRTEEKTNNILLLRRALKEEQIQLIGILSQRDFEELFSANQELLEFFTCVSIDEPEEELALTIARHVCVELEREYAVNIEERAIERAVSLATDYILNEYHPAKAIKILQQACEHVDYARTQNGEHRTEVTTQDIVHVVAQLSGLPAETFTGIARKLDYESIFTSFVVGQEHAIKTVATELKRIKAGWTDSNKPATVLLFAGLTGVGKTELAKALAQFYSSSKRLQTYTMGNFTEPHSISGIIGTPPGYVGHEQGGRLINDLNADPYCVFLLDEAEKAHPEVWKPFLNLFDEAWITDTCGVKAFADKAIFILTTNAGSEIVSQMWLEGERDTGKITERVKNALTNIRHERSHQPVFSPELLARIKRIIIFNPLDQEAMEAICRKHIAKIQQRWRERWEKELIVPDALLKYIAKRSHQINQRSGNKEGGRIVMKLIAELIEDNILQAQSQREDEYIAANTIEVVLEDMTTDVYSNRNLQPTIHIQFHRQSER
ncbi:chaperone protein ClpB [Ktedonobacter sp. SOSP1-52]|uniref:AAA family ATPase n=1 Tax=Ktedonobacter sp. SOSP1-52 TaxID=2778366 RepID=UPI0019160CE2|nr:AAA family ATPase [Ktedonobacter sp. SOSP1-52]GHO65068.1 chaperone protein ClpB [Ktedonobacter sp. SOSP1-52]